MQPLTVGRIVHYWPDQNVEPLAAIVIKVFSPTCGNLLVFGDQGGLSLQTSVILNENPAPRECTWPKKI